MCDRWLLRSDDLPNSHQVRNLALQMSLVLIQGLRAELDKPLKPLRITPLASLLTSQHNVTQRNVLCVLRYIKLCSDKYCYFY